MSKLHLTCDYCGKKYTSYQCGKYNHFCSIECRRKGAYLMSKNITVEDRKRRSAQITRINKTINNTAEKIEKSRRTKSEKGSGKGYKKYYGRHEHRIIAENKIGRPLQPGEVVHHIDGDKQNNNPDNLEVLTQSEHIKKHLSKGGGRLCSNYTDIKK